MANHDYVHGFTTLVYLICSSQSGASSRVVRPLFLLFYPSEIKEEKVVWLRETNLEHCRVSIVKLLEAWMVENSVIAVNEC